MNKDLEEAELFVKSLIEIHEDDIVVLDFGIENKTPIPHGKYSVKEISRNFDEQGNVSILYKEIYHGLTKKREGEK